MGDELIIILEANPLYANEETLKSQLVQARVDVHSKGFDIRRLAGNQYEIKLPNPPENYREIFQQWGRIVGEQGDFLKKIYPAYF